MRHLCFFTALLLPGAACVGQTSVDLYGIADVGLRAGTEPTSVASGVDSTSRWGIKGRESLGGGWQALFRLEGGINADTGASAKRDRLFDRQAWAGLDSPYGLLAFGRQPNLISDALVPVDPLGKRDASFNPNINVAGLSNTAFGGHALGHQYGPSGYADNAYRLDNTVKYTAHAGPWQARAAYALGEGTGATAAGASHGVALAYERPDWVVSGATMQFRTADNLPLDAWSLGAAVRAGAWQFKANAARNRADTGANTQVRQRVLSAGVSRAVGHGLLVTTAWYAVRRTATLWRDDGFDRAFLFVEKTLAPRTTAYVEADYTNWRTDRHETGVTLGLKQTF